VLAQRPVDGRSIKAIPELLDMLNLKGAIVSIDPMGTQKEIAARLIDKGGDYVLALKGDQTSLHDDASLYFADTALTADCPRAAETDAGHGRIEWSATAVADRHRQDHRRAGWEDWRGDRRRGRSPPGASE